MAIKISQGDIPQALEFLKEQLPRSSLTYLPLKYVQMGRLKRSVWVDQWPQCNAVILTPEHWHRDNTTINVVSMFASVDSNLEDMLITSGVIETERMFALGLPKDVFLRLEACLLQGPESRLRALKSAHLKTVTLYCDEIIYDGELPSTYSVRKLTGDDARLVASHWYTFPGIEDYIRDCIEVTDLSICVINQEGEPIAWSVKHIYGAIGFTHVLHSYRGTGLGKYVTATLSREIISADGFCMACISADNVPSIRIHETVGFKSTDICTIFIELAPRKKLPLDSLESDHTDTSCKLS